MNQLKLLFFGLYCVTLGANAAHAQEEETLPLETEIIFVMPFAGETDEGPNQHLLHQQVMENFGDRAPFSAQDLQSLGEETLDSEIAIDASCQKSECLDEIAQALGVRGIVYGSLTTTEVGLKWEIKLFDADKGRIVAKTDVEASNHALIAEQTVTLVDNLMANITPRPPKPPPVKKTLWDSSLFVSGLALSAVSATALIGSIGYVVDAELRLGDPDVHRDLKAEALTYGPNGVWLAMASGAILVVGLGVTGVGFVLHE